MAGPPNSQWGTPAPVPAPPPPEHDYEPIHPGSGRGDWRERLKRYGGPIAAGALLLATKLKAILLLLPKVKFLTTSATMLVSIAAYALIWGWQFAVGFVLLLFVHEIGHVIQLRREGIEASAPMFIPFLGAVVAAKSMGDDAAAEARVGLAGPILGTLGDPDPARDLDRDRQRVLAGARLRRLLHQPLQPAAGAAARRRPGDGGALALGLGRGLRRPDRADVRLLQPDPAADPGLRRASSSGTAGRPQDARGARLPRDPGAHPGAGRGGLPGARGALAVGVDQTFLEKSLSDV